MEENLQFGKTFEYKSHHNGVVTSVTRGLTRSIEVKDKYDAQSKLLEFYKLIETGKTKDLTFQLFANDQNEVKRMEVTMITEKTSVHSPKKQ